MNAFWMITASLFFACMGACVKFGAGRFHLVELVFWRGAIALIAILVYIRWHRLSVRTMHWRWQSRRALSGTLALCCYFWAITHLPLATAVTLNYTSPIFLALMMSLQERPSRRTILSLGLGLLGVGFVLRPTLTHDQWGHALIGLLSGFLASLAYLSLRRLGEAKEPEWRTVFWFAVVCTLVGSPALAVDSLRSGWSLHDAVIVLGVGGFGLAAQLALTRALGSGKTLVTVSLAYSTVIFSSFFGALIWHDRLTLLSWGGIAAIIAAGILATTPEKDVVKVLEQD